MGRLRDMFNDRTSEINSYLTLLNDIEAFLGAGNFRIPGSPNNLTPLQQSMLYSGTYLQLYNLVEATMNLFIQVLREEITIRHTYRYKDLKDDIRNEWIRNMSKSHQENKSASERHEAAIELSRVVSNRTKIYKFTMEKKKENGNWAREDIEGFLARLGIAVAVDQPLNILLNRHYVNNLDALKTLRSIRNNLAHGEKSFREVGDGKTANDIAEFKTTVCRYVECVITAMEDYLDNKRYIR